MSWRGPQTAGRPQGRPNKPCYDFRRTGQCRYGARCRYSHDLQSSDTRPSAAPKSSQTTNTSGSSRHVPPKQHDGKLREWKRLLVQGEPPSQPSPTAVKSFFALGLEIMDGDLGAAQEAIKLLVTEAGLSFIKTVSDRSAQAHYIPDVSHYLPGEDLRTGLWNNAIRPLFKILTHPRVVDSAVLEQEVAACFNFLLGVGGTRIERLGRHIANLLGSWNDHTMQSLSRMEVLELSLAVLSKILDFNTTTIVNERFAKLVSGFSTILDQIPVTNLKPEDAFSHQQASKYLDYINRRLQVGNDIVNFQGLPQTPVTREQFVLRRDLPGALSADGPRHDNDHAEIPKIRILPTYEEIISPRAEYLPTKDPSEWHIQGILGRLDREFRLVREDNVGPLRDVVRELLDAIRNPGQRGNRQGAQDRNSVRTLSYDTPQLIDVEFDTQGGLELTIRCAQLPFLRKVDINARRQWWGQCKRLQSGALVCVLDATGSVIFCVVSDSTIRNSLDKPRRQRNDQEATPQNLLTLSDDDEYLFVRLQLVSPSPREIRQVLRWYQPVSSSPRRYLVEFPGVLLASFQHTLAALQQMYRKPDIPFHDILAPTESTQEPKPLEPPRYARKRGFVFDAKCLTKDRTPLSLQPSNPGNATVLEEKTKLDPTQSVALNDSLSRELAIIQGPPGTGKSFSGERLIELLLANKTKANLGPILCVCYTNHALDQLLEHLVDAGTKGIIRIGSRSKSERLEDLNLRVVSRLADRTKTERMSLYELDREQIPQKLKEATDALNSLAASQSWKTVEAFLATTYPHHHKELFGEDEEGWTTVGRHPEQAITKWLKGGGKDRALRTIDHLKLAGLTTMTQGERQAIYRFWLRCIRDPILAEIVSINSEYTDLVNQRNRLRGDVDLRCLQEANVVGVTTTGLARQLDILRKLRCKVLVCEEAGEVLEAHILTALLPSVEHAILIGDHLQLRPQIQNYELQSVNPRGERYSLDMSLFERLVKPPSYQSNGSMTIQLPFSMLETQRRMHPSISDLIRKTLYPSLKDGPNVSEYPEVVGMRRRLFWMHHEFPEAGSGNSHDPVATSHTNRFEMEMTIALVCHLVRQGEYSKDDIAVITPYLGQLQQLRRGMQSMFEICLNDRDQEDIEALEQHVDGNSSAGEVTGEVSNQVSPRHGRPTQKPGVAKTTLLNSIRVATVDNFQGEEAKVVIISLVRSNPQQNCGFLKTSNRINVLLSRAKHGMYIIGNANTYGNVPMWAEVLGMLRKDGNFGTAFELQCPRHPATPLKVSSPDQFMQFSPESGCNLPCDKRLRCGHSCTGRCHSQLLHDALKCLEACPRPLAGGSCAHPCPRKCGDICPERCVVHLTGLDLALTCGHKIKSAKCWETRDLASIKCQVQVERKVPGCDHKVLVRCHIDVNQASYRCTARCGETWSTCGHACGNMCYQCRPDRKKDSKGVITVTEGHPMCMAKCGRNYKNCRHGCEEKCHGGQKRVCPPCEKPCEVRCGHSKCSKKCSEPCAPCAERTCHSKCPHGGCTMPCAAPCNWIPCSLRCEKNLVCGHRCPSVCGEPCPESKYCQECSSESIKSTCVDFLEMKDYQDIDLNEEPCIFPDCGHFLTVTSMDGQMDMAGHYTLDVNGLPVAINKASEPFSMDQGEPIRVCPTCRGSLRNIARYGRIVRRGMLDEATKKFISWSNERYLALAEEVVTEQERLASLGLPDGYSASGSRHHHPADDSKPKSKIPRIAQIQFLETLVPSATLAGRYAAAVKLCRKINSFVVDVRREEQPFQRVADLVRHSNRLRRAEQLSKSTKTRATNDTLATNGQTDDLNDPGTSQSAPLLTPSVSEEQTEFVYDESVIQVKGLLLATLLFSKCEIMVFEDFVRLLSAKKITLPTVWPQAGDKSRKNWLLGGQVDIGVYLRGCDAIIRMAKAAKHPKEQVQGHIFYARFCGFAIVLGRGEAQAVASGLAGMSVADVGEGRDQNGEVQDAAGDETTKRHTELKEEGLAHLSVARAITEQYPSTVTPPSTLAAEIDAAEKFLNEGTFYEAVTADELRAVYQAMSMEFRGTGHWYTCENGHPFTVGECGMPMEQARCPECGGVVGGRDHINAPGVRRDEVMEEMARGVERMRV